MKKWTPVKGVHFLRFLCGLGLWTRPFGREGSEV